MNWFQNVIEIYGFDEEEKSQNSFHEFKEKDFIILRTLGGNGNATFHLERSAEKNNSQAQELLSAIYFGGLEGCTDYVKARKYNEILAQKNNSNALFRLGYLYDEGLGVGQDYKKAKEYYELSAAQNNPQALFCLGRLYEYGKGVKQDYLKSKEYYEMSSSLNNIESYFSLGFLYFGVERDYVQAK